MSAQRASMHDFIEQLMRETPRELHPSANQIIHEYFCDMKSAVDDPAEVWRPAQLVRDKVALELGFLAFGPALKSGKSKLAAQKLVEQTDG